MIPLRVTAKNYGPYPTVDWKIPRGLSAIVGENLVGDGADSNGSGKTKLLELVPICLFGPALPWSEYLTVGAEETTCTVTLEFEHNHEMYRVIRTYDSKGRGKTTLDFFIADATYGPGAGMRGEITSARPLTRGDQKETQQLILDTIGLSAATFAHSVFAAQGHPHFADPALPPRERKAILAEALNLGLWDNLRDLCRRDISDLQASIADIESKLAAFADDLAEEEGTQIEVDGLKEHVKHAEADLIECLRIEDREAKHHAELQAASETRRALEQQAEATKALLDRLEEDVTRGAEEEERAHLLTVQIETIRPLAESYPELETRVRDLDIAAANRERARLDHERLLAEAKTHDERAANLVREAVVLEGMATDIEAKIIVLENEGAGVCDHCGQAIAGRSLEQSIVNQRAEAAELRRRASESRNEAQGVKSAADSYRQQAGLNPPPQEMGAKEAKIRHDAELARPAVSELVKLTAERDAALAVAAGVKTVDFESKLRLAVHAASEASLILQSIPEVDADELSAATRDLERARTDVVAARATDRDLRAKLAAAEEWLSRIRALAIRAQAQIEERTNLQARLETLTALARSYGRDGIPALIMEANAIPRVEETARAVLEQMGMPFRVELVTQRENKTGGFKDTLDVVVHEPNGPRRYETYSGGERTRLELALRIALARLIAGQSAAHCGLLALDEPSWLDATGMAQLAEVLRGLTEFESIVLVSHDERLVEAFDQTVHVVRDESGSRLRDAA